MTMHRGIIRQSIFFHVDAHLGFIYQCYGVTRNIYIPGKSEIKNYTFRKMCLCTCLSTPVVLPKKVETSTKSACKYLGSKRAAGKFV